MHHIGRYFIEKPGIIIIELSQINPSIISGNQKWNGAAHIFVKFAVSINIEEHFLDVISLLDSIMIIGCRGASAL